MKKRILQNGDWVSPKPGCAGYLTPGMKYQVYRTVNAGDLFYIVDDVYDEIACMLRGSAHSINGWYIHSTAQDDVEDNVENLIEIL